MSLPAELILDIFSYVIQRPAHLLSVPPLRWPHRNRALLQLARVCRLWACLAQSLLLSHVELGLLGDDADPTIDAITYQTAPSLRLLLGVLLQRPELSQVVQTLCVGSGHDSFSMDPLQLSHAPTVHILHPSLQDIAQLVAHCPNLQTLDLHIYHPAGIAPVMFTLAEQLMLAQAQGLRTLRFAHTCRWRHDACSPAALFQLISSFPALRSLTLDAPCCGNDYSSILAPLTLADMRIVGIPPTQLSLVMHVGTLTLVHPPANMRIPDSVANLIIHELQTPLDLSNLSSLHTLSIDPPDAAPRGRRQAQPEAIMTSASAVQQTIASARKAPQLQVSVRGVPIVAEWYNEVAAT